mgnify:CR=1 FL=1
MEQKQWIFMDVHFMIHAVDLAAWYLPDIEEVYGVGVTSQNTKDYQLTVPDTMKFIFKKILPGSAQVSAAFMQNPPLVPV